MPWDVFKQALYFILDEYGSETITLGGGEPTLHPRFFDILREALSKFDHVWMATNGSQTDKMQRLHSIIQDSDFEIFSSYLDEDDEECDYDYSSIVQNPDGKLNVAVSQDWFHQSIDPWVTSTWGRYVGLRNSHYEIRDVTRSGGDGVARVGRAVRTQVGHSNHCPCSSHIIRPDGSIKMCGCTKAPIIGNVMMGLDLEWVEKMYDSGEYNAEHCWTAFKGGKKDVRGDY